MRTLWLSSGNLRFAALGLAVLAPSLPARAQSDAGAPCEPNSPAPCTRPVVLTVSGGISLGAYQSGVNWAFLHLIKRATVDDSFRVAAGLERYDLTVATGASAGNINALLSSVEWARDGIVEDVPEKSLFWRAWTPVGAEQLLPGFHRPAEQSALSRQFFDDVIIPEYVKPDLRGDDIALDTDVAVGIALTRLNPSNVSIERSDGRRTGLRVQSQRAVSIYRIAAAEQVDSAGVAGRRLLFGHHGASRRPSRDPLTACDDARTTAERTGAKPAYRDEGRRCFDRTRFGQLALMPFGNNADENEDLVFRLAQASSAFPGAWAPMDLRVGRGRTREGWELGAETVTFLDGGVFDNNPLGLAYELYTYLKAEPDNDPTLPAFEERERTPGVDWNRPVFLYIDPDDRRPRTEDPPVTPTAPGLSQLWRFSGGAVGAARQHEVEMLARRLTSTERGWLSTTDRFFPVVGVHLGAFGSFLERPFREHDFYVGVYDGFHYVARHLTRSCVAARDQGGNPEAAERTVAGCAAIALDVLHGLSGPERLGPEADFVFRRLYAEEFGHAPTLPEIPFDKGDGGGSRVVLQALLDTNDELRGGPDEVNFSAFVRTFAAQPHARQVMLGWADECRGARAAEADSLRFRIDCQAEPWTALLLDDPDEWILRGGELLMMQLQRVENPNGTGFETPVELAHFAIATARQRRQTGLRWAESSIPLNRSYLLPRRFLPSFVRPEPPGNSVTGGVFYRLVPYEISFRYIERGFAFGYRPTYRFSPSLAAVGSLVPLRLDRTLDVEAVRDGGDVDEAWDWNRNRTVGLGLLLSPPKSVFGLSSFEARVTHTSSWRPWYNPFERDALGAEFAVYALFNKLRVSLESTRMIGEYGLDDAQGVALTLGLSDFNGLLYWFRAFR